MSKYLKIKSGLSSVNKSPTTPSLGLLEKYSGQPMAGQHTQSTFRQRPEVHKLIALNNFSGSVNRLDGTKQFTCVMMTV